MVMRGCAIRRVCWALCAVAICGACTDLADDELQTPDGADAADAGSGPIDAAARDSGPNGDDTGVGGSGADDTDSGNAGEDATADNAPPVIAIDFPPSGLTRLTSVHARGTISDPDADAIASLVVNGVEATIDGNAWSALVPLSAGGNDLVATAQDARGAVAETRLVRVEQVAVQLENPSDFAYDTAQDRALVIDAIASGDGQSSVYALYWMAAGARAPVLVSSSERGSGPAFERPTAVVIDIANDRAFVLDTELGAVLEVDLATGDRTVLLDATTPAQPGGGPAFATPTDLVLDPEGARLFVADHGANAVFAVDADTGVRSVISDAADGSALSEGTRMSLDAASDRIFAITYGGYPVTAIDLADGTRTRIADLNDGLGYPATNWHAIAADGANGRVLVREWSRVIALDLTSRTRRVIAELGRFDPRLEYLSLFGLEIDAENGDVLALSSDDAELLRCNLSLDPAPAPLSNQLHGTGPDLGVGGMVAEPGETSLLVADEWQARLARVDLATGDRSVISSDAIGTGRLFDHPSSIAVDTTYDRAIVLDRLYLVAVDLASGDRTVISTSVEPAVGSGPSIGHPRALSQYVDIDNDRVIVVSGDRLLAIDLTTGDRSVFSGPAGAGTGPLPAEFRDLAYDFAGQRYLAIGDDDAVFAIDAATGNRTVVSGPSAGSAGPAFTDARQIDYDVTNHVAWVFDRPAGIVAVDLVTGDRELIQPLSMAIEDMVVLHRRGIAAIGVADGLASVELSSDAVESEFAPPRRGRAVLPVMDDLATGQAYELTPGGIAVIELASGERQELEGDGFWPVMRGSGFFDRAGSRVYGLSFTFFGIGAAALSYADLTTGDRALLSSRDLGDGPLLSGPAAGVMDTRRMRPLVLDVGLPAVLAVDPTTGDRTNVSGPPVGDGPAWSSPQSLRYDHDGDRALVLEANALVAADLETGNRVIISGDDMGSGPALTQARAMDLDLAGGRAIVRDIGQAVFVAIDLRNGTRSVLAPDPAPPANGDSVLGYQPFEIDYDPESRTLFVFDTNRGRGLLRVDELTGDWVVVLGRVP